MQVNTNINNSVSFGRIIFKNRSIYAKYGNGIVGKIRSNEVVHSFKNREDLDIVFSAEAARDGANFYWQICKSNGFMNAVRNLFLPKVFFKSSQLRSRPNVDEITQDLVSEYINKYLN